MASFPSKNSLRGNVLFIVLLGVVLFGALSYAVVNSNSDSGDTGSAEQARIYAGEILRYAQTMRITVDRMLMNGVSESDLRFAHPDLDAAYGTLGTTPKNEVYHPDGGGMSYLKPKEEWLDNNFKTEAEFGTWTFSSRNNIPHTGTGNCSSADCEELIMFLPYVTQQTCMALNSLLGIHDENTVPTQDSAVMRIYEPFAGSFHGSPNGIGESGNTAFLGLETYCLEGGGTPVTGSYHFYQALILR